MLAKERWCIMDILMDGPQQLEAVQAEYDELRSSSSKASFVAEVVALYEAGLLRLDRQAPSQADSQTLSTQHDLVWSQSDLVSQGYAGSSEVNPVEAFLSPAIWLSITAAGMTEWDAPQYESFWRSTPSPTLGWARADRMALGLTLATVTFALTALAIRGWLDSSWSYGPDCHVSLSEELLPLQTALRAAGAPEAALQRLRQAALPNQFASHALDLLIEADQRLAPVSDSPLIKEARLQLLTVMNHAHPAHCGP